MNWFRFAACCGALFLLAGCSETTPAPAAKKEPEKPAEPIGGQKAVFTMYPSARGWAPDAQPLRCQSILLQEMKEVRGAGGKAGAWRCTFTSQARARSRTYTWSAVSAENLPKGVFAGQEEGLPSGAAKPFPMAAVKTDTDAAYETSLKNKGADYAKKNPDKPVIYLLEANPRHPNPTYRVIWGESVGTSNFSVFVDAATGQFLEVMR